MSSEKKGILYFSPQEKKDLIISWLTLSLAFAVLLLPLVSSNYNNPLLAIPVALIMIGTGFVMHELAHREVAKSFGFHSEFRAWYPGLLIAVILALSPLKLIFAAPGATYFFGENVSSRQNGIISMAGPIINLIIGTIMLWFGLFIVKDFFQFIFIQTAYLNFFFAFFNLLPIYPLDGSKVFSWKFEYWAILIVISGGLVLFFNLI